MLYVLTARPEIADLPAALAELERQHPHWRVIPKLDRVFELEAEASLEVVTTLLPPGWGVHAMTYASIDPPGVSLQGLRAKLAQLREAHR